MFRFVTVLLLASVVSPLSASTVSLLHFSDYHSHTQPFYSEGSEKGGVARAVAILKRHKRQGALVFNGGDTMNKGAPAWSDKYRCAEWAWFNGVVDAMAFGNHDADYGNEELARCRSEVAYPLLSANTVGFERYRVFSRGGIRIGVFAVAGPDFPRLVTSAKLEFSDPVAAARDVVQTLRERQHVDAVIMIGHQHAADDYKLAELVPGIDVIFGTHTHLKREITRIPGTETWFISPFQYLTYISAVDLKFEKKKLKAVTGRLIPVDATITPDAKIAARVASMQHALEQDPAYRDLFVPLTKLAKPMELDELARLAIDTMRNAANAELAMSTTSSFRQPLPAGTIDLETLRAAMPYDNEIVLAKIRGSKLAELYTRALGDPASEARSYATARPETIDPERMYLVAVTDYMAFVSTAFRDLFEPSDLTRTGLRVRSEVATQLKSGRTREP